MSTVFFFYLSPMSIVLNPMYFPSQPINSHTEHTENTKKKVDEYMSEWVKKHSTQ